jgi:hypothetical protein
LLASSGTCVERAIARPLALRPIRSLSNEPPLAKFASAQIEVADMAAARRPVVIHLVTLDLSSDLPDADPTRLAPPVRDKQTRRREARELGGVDGQ